MTSLAQYLAVKRLGVGAQWNARAGKFMHEPCSGRTCTNDAGFADTPFCETCAMALWVTLDEHASDEAKAHARAESFLEYAEARDAKDAARRVREAMTDAQRREAHMTKPGTIYYLRVGDLVKIGYTTSLDARMRQYPPNATLLAQHPGTRETEREMHNKFAAKLDRGREWFKSCAEIDEHIAAVQEAYPLKREAGKAGRRKPRLAPARVIP